MKLLLDEIYPIGIAEQLRLRGHDVIAVLERKPELVAQPDEVIFVAAQAEQRTIVTENIAHFRGLGVDVLELGRSHYGLIFTTSRVFPRTNAGRIVTALDSLLQVDPSLNDLEHWLASP